MTWTYFTGTPQNLIYLKKSINQRVRVWWLTMLMASCSLYIHGCGSTFYKIICIHFTHTRTNNFIKSIIRSSITIYVLCIDKCETHLFILLLACHRVFQKQNNVWFYGIIWPSSDLMTLSWCITNNTKLFFATILAVYSCAQHNALDAFKKNIFSINTLPSAAPAACSRVWSPSIININLC